MIDNLDPNEGLDSHHQPFIGNKLWRQFRKYCDSETDAVAKQSFLQTL